MTNDGFTIPEVPRATQQGIQPTAVKNSALSAGVLANTESETLGPFTVNNGSALDLTSTIANANNESIRLGALPYMVAYYQTSVADANLIPFASGGDYKLFGPIAIPEDYSGSDGFNLVFKTRLVNNTGGSKTIYIVTHTRFFSGVGGSGNAT